ncbi:sugar transferase [Epilithonimonas lactis]|uniref:sugar transferase n=1 Tax=Epilithonimonas lactis TaxID=421072 RepID=UPI0008D6175D|nr:sugar transferase [Epilithonimonas lactis]SEP78686.1 Sugar transferase involved in LPS biosynthesis (colanic, teichoic acid) [Epilithonimonas lactis]
MIVKTYLKVSNPVQRCLFINVSDISLKLFRGTKLRRSFKVIRYNSEINTKSILEYVNRLNIKTIVIETSNLNHLPENLTNDIIDARLSGVRVFDAQEFYEIVNRRIPLVKLSSNEYLADDIFSIGLKHHSGLSSKRIIDLLVVLSILPVALPLVVLGCLLTLLSSSGNVLFVQERIGVGSKKFKIYKIRTMKSKHNGGYTTSNDDRITIVGKFLRLSKIDELPQLYNILRGDMSLIGPRPERPEFVDLSNEENAYFDLRHVIKPGVTGWAQVNLPKATPDDNLKKLEYDLYYIKNYSPRLDIEILLRTIKVVMTMNSN